MKLDKLWAKKDIRYSRRLTADAITAEDLPLTSQDDTVLFQTIPALSSTDLGFDGGSHNNDGHSKSSKRQSKVCDLPIRVKTIIGKDHVRRRVLSTPANFKVAELPQLDALHISGRPSIDIPQLPVVRDTEAEPEIQPPPVMTKQAVIESPINSYSKVRSRNSLNLRLAPSSLRHVSMPQSTSYATYSSNRISCEQHTTRISTRTPPQDEVENPCYSQSDYCKIIQIYLDSNSQINNSKDYRPPLPAKNSPLKEKFQQKQQQQQLHLDDNQDLGLIREDIESQFSSPELELEDSDYNSSACDASTISSVGQLGRFITASESPILQSPCPSPAIIVVDKPSQQYKSTPVWTSF